MKAVRSAWILIAALALLSCEELLFKPVPDTSPGSIFNQVWRYVDEHYSFFAYKAIDWSGIKAEFEPRILDTMTDEELFGVVAEMLFVLRDGHVNLTSTFDRSRNWQWYLDYPANYDYALLERSYFKGEEQYVDGAFILMDFKDETAGDVGYIHYRSFMNTIRQRTMDHVLEKFKDHKGLIIDIRNNGGGNLNNVYALANQLVDTRIAFAQERIKTGPGHDDFGPLRTLFLEPPADGITFTKPVVVLTNSFCYSGANYFTTAVKNLPHVTVMGYKTGGGGGIPAYTELTNGWGLRVSTTQLFILDNPDTGRSLNDRNVEDGVDPDHVVEMDPDDLSAGTDTLLEAALAFLRD
jgi:hypothetical protein